MQTMDSKTMYPAAGTFAVFLLMVVAVEAAPTTALPIKDPLTLTCSGIKHPNGSGTYTLSRPPASQSCTYGFEDENRTAITYGKDFGDPKTTKVLHLTDQSITLKELPGVLHYLEDCNGKPVVANCTVHSPPLDLVQAPTTENTTVNSTKICLSETVCVDQNIVVGLVILAILLLAAGFGGVYLWKWYNKRQRTAEATAYTAVNDDIKIGSVGNGVQPIEVYVDKEGNTGP